MRTLYVVNTTTTNETQYAAVFSGWLQDEN